MAVVALSQFGRLNRVKIVKIRGKGDFHRRLSKMGLVVGAIIEIVKLGDEAVLLKEKARKGEVLLRRSEMAGIHVEIV
jgi:Fe2+ transport system protein FeoA